MIFQKVIIQFINVSRMFHLINWEKFMRAVDIIAKKRDHLALTREEIEFFVRGFTSGEIPDYQAAAWAMAVVLNGMTSRETSDLTLAMAFSGDVIDLTNTVSLAVDKHSTGGVGDKTTLVVEPTVAACGLPVAKMSGRGLGFTGGTLDKMESIPGYRVNLTTQEFMHQLERVGLVLCGQTADLAPADGKFYALRDVTATVQSIPLIASSIMSKKIAGGAQRILLDVKVGRGAFMVDLESARELAKTMVKIGKKTGRDTVALLSDMDQPLGTAVGNSIEVEEAIDTLHGGGPEDFRQHCLTAAAQMLVLGEMAEDEVSGFQMAEEAISSGKSLERFRDLVKAQGGDVSYVDHPEKFPHAKLTHVISAQEDGFLKQMDARLIGEASVLLGAGRAKKGDSIDHAVGILVSHKIGDRVEKQEPLITLLANQQTALEEAIHHLSRAVEIDSEPVEPLPLFYDVIHWTDVESRSHP
jgi:pyrimidine-nucleoside phosphorylase